MTHPAVSGTPSLDPSPPTVPPSFPSRSSSSSQPSTSTSNSSASASASTSTSNPSFTSHTSRSTAPPAHLNLPAPPPSDRLPPPKGRASHHAGQRLNKLLKKGRDKDKDKDKDKGRHNDDDEEEWMIEGGGNTNGHPSSLGTVPVPVPMMGITNGGISLTRASVDMVRPLDNPPTGGESASAMFDSQMTEVPAERKSHKGRSLAKKTSQLFNWRERDRSEADHTSMTPSSQSSLNLPGGSRQASYSSTTSSETSTSNSHSNSNSAGRHFPSLTRPLSHHSRTKHSRRPSQDSQSSWQGAGVGPGAPKSTRSGSTSTYESPVDLNGGSSSLPIPRRLPSHMSASVPSLSRNALPQPAPQSSTSNQSSIPSRMSSWFSNLLPSSAPTTGSPLPPTDPAGSSYSPSRRGPSAAANFLYSARQKAVDGVRNLLDSEAQPDRCADTIWVMGVGHPGYRPSTPRNASATDLPELGEEAQARRGSGSSGRPSPPARGDTGGLRPSAWPRKADVASQSGNGPTSPPNNGFGQLFTPSTLSLTAGSPSKDTESKAVAGESPGKMKKDRKDKEVLKWPEQFYDDFRSRVWCTYRSQYAPIASLPNNILIPSAEAYYAAFGPPADPTSVLQPTHDSPTATGPQSKASSWGWARDERGLTSDSGWGCMLRTGQSMLANALIHLQLGRGWRVPLDKPTTAPRTIAEVEELEAYAQYVRLMSWFLDDPSPLCPFSVHRMALIGKELGKEVGEWFGPSTAAGALKTLTNSFPICGLAVATATDSMVYKSDVYAASNLPSDGWADLADDITTTPRSSSSPRGTLKWGDKAVLILIGLRLGLDGVNPIYYDSIKALFAFPQSVGIAGGRPSSSYFFVGTQANSLFYLDPHFTRPAIPLEIPPAPAKSDKSDPLADQDDEEAVIVDKSAIEPAPFASATEASHASHASRHAPYTLDVVDVDDLSSDADSDLPPRPSRTSTAAKRLSGPISSLPRSTPPTSPPRGTVAGDSPDTPIAPTRATEPDVFDDGGDDSHTTPAESLPTPKPSARRSSATSSQDTIPRLQVDPQLLWYADAYPANHLRTFHCEKVKKMPFSGLDPSMLLGFLVRNEADFEDFCERAAKLPQKIFSVQDEPPSWDEDDEAGLESVSEPDLDEENEDPAGDAEGDGEDNEMVEVLSGEGNRVFEADTRDRAIRSGVGLAPFGPGRRQGSPSKAPTAPTTGLDKPGSASSSAVPPRSRTLEEEWDVAEERNGDDPERSERAQHAQRAEREETPLGAVLVEKPSFELLRIDETVPREGELRRPTAEAGQASGATRPPPKPIGGMGSEAESLGLGEDSWVRPSKDEAVEAAEAAKTGEVTEVAEAAGHL